MPVLHASSHSHVHAESPPKLPISASGLPLERLVTILSNAERLTEEKKSLRVIRRTIEPDQSTYDRPYELPSVVTLKERACINFQNRTTNPNPTMLEQLGNRKGGVGCWPTRARCTHHTVKRQDQRIVLLEVDRSTAMNIRQTGYMK